MAIRLLWENESRTIIRMEVVGRWTWNEMFQASQQGYAMLETVDHIVDPIIDFRQSEGLPDFAISNSSRMIGKRHPRTGVTMIVTTHPLFLGMWNAFRRVYVIFAKQEEFRLVKTLDEALSVLKQVQAEREAMKK